MGSRTIAKLIIETPEEMHELGERLAQIFEAGDLVLLTGPLGAGKTTMTRGVGEAMGAIGNVSSPTFVIARTHRRVGGGPNLVHVDAYRLTQASSFDDLMIWDSAVSPWNVIVEWPEKVASRLPRSLWKLKATILADGGHQFTLSVN